MKKIDIIKVKNIEKDNFKKLRNSKKKQQPRLGLLIIHFQRANLSNLNLK